MTGLVMYGAVNMTCAVTSEVLYYPFQKFTCEVVIKVRDLIYFVLSALFIDTKYGRTFFFWKFIFF